MIFGTIEQPQKPYSPRLFANGLGIDLIVSLNGYGLGTFYRHEYSDDFSTTIDFSISESKDEDEIELVDYYGNRFTPGKVNRFLLMPLMFGVEKRFFQDEIMDNFRPYLDAAVGPTMLFVFPYELEYFNALGKGHPKYTFSGYIGIGSYFGAERSSLFGMNIRYYFIPYPGGIESLKNVYKKQFGGLYITMSFGSTW